MHVSMECACLLRRIVNPRPVTVDGVEGNVVYIDTDGKTAVGHRFTSHTRRTVFFVCASSSLLRRRRAVIKQGTGVAASARMQCCHCQKERDTTHSRIHCSIILERWSSAFASRKQEFGGSCTLLYLLVLALSNVQDLITSMQSHDARKARRIIKQFWKLRIVQRGAPAIRIHKCYRAMRARNAGKAFQLFRTK